MNRLGWVHNEKGAGWLFTFALVMVLVIAIMTPTMLQLISSRNLTDVKIEQETIVNQMAVGGIEAFIAYLRDYQPTQGSKVNYFKNYLGWGTHQVTTPDGKTITYELSLENTSIQNVTSRLTPYTLVLKSSSSKPYAYEKEIKYEVVLFEKNPLLDTSKANEKGIIIPGEASRLTAEQFEESFNLLIPADDWISEEFADFNQLQDHIDNLTNSPSELIVKIKTNELISIKSDLDFTKISKLIIYVDGNVRTNGNRDLLMKGMLLVNGDLDGGASHIEMNNLIVNGDLSNVGGSIQSTVATLDPRNNVGGNDNGKGVGNEGLNVALDPALEYDYLNQSASDAWGIERTN